MEYQNKTRGSLPEIKEEKASSQQVKVRGEAVPLQSAHLGIATFKTPSVVYQVSIQRGGAERNRGSGSSSFGSQLSVRTSQTCAKFESFRLSAGVKD